MAFEQRAWDEALFGTRDAKAEQETSAAEPLKRGRGREYMNEALPPYQEQEDETEAALVDLLERIVDAKEERLRGKDPSKTLRKLEKEARTRFGYVFDPSNTELSPEAYDLRVMVHELEEEGSL
jgi:hypothetical protein